MRKYNYIFIIFLTAIAMIIISSTNVVKASNTTQEKTVEYNEEIDAKKLEDIHSTKFKVLTTPKVKVEANPTQEDVSKYYYNQLKHDVSRNTYNALSSQSGNSVIVNLNNLEYDIASVSDEEIIRCFDNYLKPYVMDGYEAFIMDGSHKYWWTPESIKFGEITADVSNGKASFKTAQIISKDSEWTDYQNFETTFRQVCDSITGNSTYEIARSINHYIFNTVEYKVLPDTTMEQSAYGALILKKAVCEGQAQLFNLLCREKGVMCINVYGWTGESRTTAHAWNYIYEPTKKQWYAVDVTWNNYEKDPLYFMIGSDTEINGVKFERNHEPGFKQYTVQTYIPASPTLANDRYITPITVDDIYIKNIEPNTQYSEFLKEFSSDVTFTVKENGIEISPTILIKTGQILTYETSNYKLVVLGDTNGDGKADITDILAINKHRLNKKILTGEFGKAADANKDGTIDIRDILYINKYRLNKITEM